MTATVDQYAATIVGLGRALDTPLEARILERTAELLIRDGWCQGRSFDDKGRKCLVFAMTCVVAREFSQHMPDMSLEVAFLLDEVLQQREPSFDGTAERWQDQPGRSLDDVLDLIAAARAGVTS